MSETMNGLAISFFTLGVMVWAIWGCEMLKFQNLLKNKYKISAYDVRITLEDQEEIFGDGKERTYETPHGTLHVTPDSKHVVCR